MVTKKTINIIIGIAVFTALLSFASADRYQLVCLSNRQSINFGQLCSPGQPTITAPNHGEIRVCVHNLDNGKTCSATPNKCNNLGLSCSSLNSTTIDTQPPTLVIYSPNSGAVYTSKSILLSLNASEISDISFKSSNSGRWTSICSNCQSFSMTKNFEEGENDLIFKATDSSGNNGYANASFFVDTKKPKIKSFTPQTGFTSGVFKVEFSEDNPASLKLKYGNSQTGMRSADFNLAACDSGNGGTKICEIQVDLSQYDGQQVEAWAEISDIAGNSASSAHNTLKVDFSNPAINSLNIMKEGKNVEFKIELNEANPDSVSYIDNLDSNPKWKTLCSRMTTSSCNKKASFNDGNHEVVIKAVDLAGNVAERNVEFFTDSKKPVIKKTSPSSGFASGDFDVEFDEQNPSSLILFYGNSQTGMRQKSVNIEADCIVDRNYKCSTSVALGDYNGQKIDYYFVLSDLASQSVQSKKVKLDVDTAFPVIESVTHVLSRNKATITIKVNEQNLDQIAYMNDADSVPRWKNFCSVLRNGMCSKTITLSNGVNSLHFQVDDKAGNSVGRDYEIDL